MSVKDFVVTPCDRNEIKEFIEHWHYSNNVNGVNSPQCFKLLDKGDLIGAMMYGWISMAGVWKKYVGEEKHLIELRRLCCIDDTPKNTESYFIGKTLRWLKQNTDAEVIITKELSSQSLDFEVKSVTASKILSVWWIQRYNK